MSVKKWARIASIAGILCAISLPVLATEYGSWKLVDTKTSKQFVPDAKAPTSPYGKWNLVDVQSQKVFFPDAVPYEGKYGKWELSDLKVDRQWLADQYVGSEKLDGSEISRSLVNDEVEYGQNYKGNGGKVYEKDVVTYENIRQVEEKLGNEKRKSKNGAVSALIEKFRVNTLKDKLVEKPYVITHNYIETAKHTRTYEVTSDSKEKLTFKDPITKQNTSFYLISTRKSQDIKATGFEETGKKKTNLERGSDRLPAESLLDYGKDDERQIGQVFEGGSGDVNSASANTQMKTYSSGNISFGSKAGQVLYSGAKERKSLNIDQTKVSEKKEPSKKQDQKDEKSLSLSQSLKGEDSTFNVKADFDPASRKGSLSGTIVRDGVKTEVPAIALRLDQLPEIGKSVVLYNGDSVLVELSRDRNGKLEILVNAKNRR